MHKNATNFERRREVCRRRILDNITIMTFKYTDRLSKLPHSRLLHEAFLTDIELKNNGSKCWSNFLHHSAAKIGIDINNCDVNYFIVEMQKYSDKCLEDALKQFQNVVMLGIIHTCTALR